jgi:hypothetical protein
MRAEQLIDIARRYLDDRKETASTLLWSDDELLYYLNLAQRKFCKDTLILSDMTTQLITEIPIAASTPNIHYQLDPRILKIDAAILLIQAWHLRRDTIINFEKDPLWFSRIGIPSRYCIDAQRGYITLDRLTSIDDTIKLRVRRMPLNDINDSNDIPEIPEQYHEYLIEGILFHAYMKQDVEAFDMAKANTYLAIFENNLENLKREEYQYQYSDISSGFNKAFM